jgi:hypothetical protein
MPIPSNQPSGEDRVPDAVSLIRRDPHVPDLRCSPEILVERRPGERSPEDLLGNADRQVGRAPAAANARGTMIHATTGKTVAEIARNRATRGGLLAHGGPIRGPSARFIITEEGRRQAGDDAGFRLADLEDDQDSPSLQRLHFARRWSRAPQWKALRARRERDALFGFYIRDEVDNAGRKVILDKQALKTAYEAGLIDIVIDEEPFSRKELTGRLTLLERLTKLNHVLAGWVNELEVTTGLLVRIGGGIAAVLGILRILGLF